MRTFFGSKIKNEQTIEEITVVGVYMLSQNFCTRPLSEDYFHVQNNICNERKTGNFILCGDLNARNGNLSTETGATDSVKNWYTNAVKKFVMSNCRTARRKGLVTLCDFNYITSLNGLSKKRSIY